MYYIYFIYILFVIYICYIYIYIYIYICIIYSLYVLYIYICILYMQVLYLFKGLYLIYVLYYIRAHYIFLIYPDVWPNPIMLHSDNAEVPSLAISFNPVKQVYLKIDDLGLRTPGTSILCRYNVLSYPGPVHKTDR